MIKYVFKEGQIKPLVYSFSNEIKEEYEKFFNKKDSIVESVINQYNERSKLGMDKYGTTLDRTDLKPLDWINHAQQEAMDLTLYLEKLKKIIEKQSNIIQNIEKKLKEYER